MNNIKKIISNTLNKIKLYNTSNAMSDFTKIKNIGQENNSISIELISKAPIKSTIKTLQFEIYQELKKNNIEIQSKDDINIDIKINTPTIAPCNEIPNIKNIKNIIAVMANKGGVGKSTISLELAKSLIKNGVSCGILDADIYGPSIPRLCNLTQEKAQIANKKMLPIYYNNLPIQSISFLLEESSNATIWRGPMASSAMKQMLNDCEWPMLDYLIIDLPPGTGDIALTLAKQIPITGAITVTTNSYLAVDDVIKAHTMLDKLKIYNIGIIENMTSIQCPSCSHNIEIFSERAINYLQNIDILGKIPFTSAEARCKYFDEISIKAIYNLQKQPIKTIECSLN